MSEEEWDMFGDRFPIQYEKKKLLGRYGVLTRSEVDFHWFGLAKTRPLASYLQ